MFNERTAQETRRQVREKLAKMDEERTLLRKMLDDLDAWLSLNGIKLADDAQLAMNLPKPGPALGGKVEEGTNRAVFVAIVDELGARGLSAREVWNAAVQRGVRSESKKPERATAAALGSLAKRGLIRVVNGRFYPARAVPPPPPPPQQRHGADVIALHGGTAGSSERPLPPPPPPPSPPRAESYGGY